MRVLHLFNWRLRDIIDVIPVIRNQGFDAVQINPIQPLKEEDSSEWWMSYQPVGFNIGNRYGSEEDLIELCKVAHEYDVRIIADVVCNHMAGKNDGSLYPHEKVDPVLKDNPYFWKPSKNVENWKNRYEVTHYCMGLPGLDVSNYDLQNIIIDFLNKLIDCGVDGFRFDAAKSIGLPEEGFDFWPRVIYCLKKYGLIIYGEVIFSDKNLIDRYSDFINVLTNSDGSNRDKIFGFVESHDSYLDFGYTRNMSSSEVSREYLNLCKNYNNTLFFARAFDDEWKQDIVRNANMQGKKVYMYR